MELEPVKYRVPGGVTEVLQATPHPGAPPVLVLHEVWGLTPFIEGVCRDLANLGFEAAAPKLYWRDADLFTRENVREAMKTIWDLPLEERYERGRIRAAVARAHASTDVDRLLSKLYDRAYRRRIQGDVLHVARALSKGRKAVGAVGYSMGGGFAFGLAARLPALRACVTFSAEPPTLVQLARTDTPMLAFYGSEDKFMTGRVPEFADSALKLGKRLTLTVYPSAGHEFFNTRDESGFDPDAAADSWRAMTSFLKEMLE